MGNTWPSFPEVLFTHTLALIHPLLAAVFCIMFSLVWTPSWSCVSSAEETHRPHVVPNSQGLFSVLPGQPLVSQWGCGPKPKKGVESWVGFPFPKRHKAQGERGVQRPGRCSHSRHLARSVPGGLTVPIFDNHPGA